MKTKFKKIVSIILFFIVCISYVDAQVPFENRKVIFYQLLKSKQSKIYDPTSESSDPKLVFHNKTNYVKYMRASNWNVIKQRLENLPYFNSFEEAARFYLSNDSYGPIFGINQNHSLDLISVKTSKNSTDNPYYNNRVFVHFQQKYNNIPVLGGELIVLLNVRKELLAVSGEILNECKIDLNPVVNKESAIKIALQEVANQNNIDVKQLNNSTPELWIYNNKLLGGYSHQLDTLAWKIQIYNKDTGKIVLVNAHNAEIPDILYDYNISDSLLNLYESGSIAAAISELSINMSDNNIDMPDRIFSPLFSIDYNDNDTMYKNSGVLRKIFYLLINGGQFNSKTINKIGFEKTLNLINETRHMLTSASNYSDLYFALIQAANNLGFNSIDTKEIKNALLASEINIVPTDNKTKGPIKTKKPTCFNGDSIKIIYKDNFDSSTINWEKGTISGTPYWFIPQTSSNIGMAISNATSKSGNVWAYAQKGNSNTYIMMKEDITNLPENSFLFFNHSFVFDKKPIKNNHKNCGLLEYSIDNGVNWHDASLLFEFNAYNGNLEKGINSKSNNKGFVANSNGYISTILDLSSIAGNTVRFRFRLITNEDASFHGWFIDDFYVYTCNIFEAMVSICSNPTIQSKQNGLWNDRATWDKNMIPNSNDIVKINNNLTMPSTKTQIKILCNSGTLISNKSTNINIYASNAIFNKGIISGQNGKNASGSNASNFDYAEDGAGVILDAPAILNEKSATIKSGNGGHENKSFSSYLDLTGKNGGFVEIKGGEVRNAGNINSGSGGGADTGNIRRTRGNAKGGNGGAILLTSIEKLINLDTGIINSGNGGNARAWSGNTATIGKGGDIDYVASKTTNYGKIFALGNGSSIYWEPDMGMSGENAMIQAANEIVIFGNDGWDLFFNNLSENSFKAASITIATGDNGSISILNKNNNVFNSPNPPKIFVDLENFTYNGENTIDALENGLKKMFNSNTIKVFDPKVLYRSSLIADKSRISGKKNEIISTSIIINNKSPDPDSFILEQYIPPQLNIEQIPEVIRVEKMSLKRIPVNIKLPEYAGQTYNILFKAKSISNPGDSDVAVIDAFVKPEIANFSIEYNRENPYIINFSCQAVSDDIIISSFEWDFGDKETSNDKSPSHTFRHQGSYNVRLKVTDNSGNQEIISKKVIVKKVKILLLAADDASYGIEHAKNAIISTNLFTESDIDIISKPTTLSLNKLMPYGSILVWSNYPFADPDHIGNILKDYVDAGGGLVIALNCFSDKKSIDGKPMLAGDIFMNGYSPFLPGKNSDVSGLINLEDSENKDHFIFNGLESMIQYNVKDNPNPVLSENAKLLAEDTYGNNIVAVNSKENIIGIAIYPGRLTQSDKNTSLLFAKSLIWVSNEPSEITVSSITQSIDSSGGFLSFTINNIGNDDMNWISESSASWLTIVRGNKGLNQGNILVNCSMNPGSLRNAEITIDAIGAINNPIKINISQQENQIPVISDIENQEINEDTVLNELILNINDKETTSNKLKLYAQSDNIKLIPLSNIFISEEGDLRKLKILPALNKFGQANITLVLDDGYNISKKSFQINVLPVNDSPNFIKGGDLEIIEKDQLDETHISNWALKITPGPYEENIQNISFNVTTDNNELFRNLPELSSDGSLSFTLEPYQNGVANVSVNIVDNLGMTGNKEQFTITVIKHPQRPSFIKGQNVNIYEDAGKQIIENWAKEISAGPNESEQNLLFIVSTNSNDLFQELPQISTIGTLSFTPQKDAFGESIVEVYLKDSGEFNNTSQKQLFSIIIKPRNDCPDFVQGTDIICLNSEKHVFPKWAGNITLGNNEFDQKFKFQIDNISNPEIFSRPPEINSNGDLTFTPADSLLKKSSIVSIYLEDSGGTSNNGCNRSAVKDFTVMINANTNILKVSSNQNANILINNQLQNFPYENSFLPGKEICLNPVPEDGFIFDKWTGSINDTVLPLCFQIEKDMDIKANFVNEKHLLEIFGCCGKVLINNILYSLPLNDRFSSNSLLKMTVIPETGYSFSNWSGDLDSNLKYAEIIISKDMHINVNFKNSTTNLFNYNLIDGWNLVSLAVIPESNNLLDIFPDAEIAYEFFQNRYLKVNRLIPGKGYFIKNLKDKTYRISGIPFTNYSFSSKQTGWFLVGGINQWVKPEINFNSGQNIFYEYINDSYIKISGFEPGKAYWTYLIKGAQLQCNIINNSNNSIEDNVFKIK